MLVGRRSTEGKGEHNMTLRCNTEDQNIRISAYAIQNIRICCTEYQNMLNRISEYAIQNMRICYTEYQNISNKYAIQNYTDIPCSISLYRLC